MEIANTSRRNQVKTEAVSTVYYIISQVPHFNLTHISTDSATHRYRMRANCSLSVQSNCLKRQTLSTLMSDVYEYIIQWVVKSIQVLNDLSTLLRRWLYISSHQRYVHHLSIYYRLYELHFNYRKSLHSKQMCVDEGFGVRKLIVFH